MIRLKRIYEPAAKQDGFRILVERLWPRGLSKERASVDLWLKDVAPSPELRKWFGHKPSRWKPFRERYWEELNDNQDAVEHLKQRLKKGTVTFVYAARDEAHNGALALIEYIEQRRK
jgi:uncharacterized protein YeaO (DUF488 family)